VHYNKLTQGDPFTKLRDSRTVPATSPQETPKSLVSPMTSSSTTPALSAEPYKRMATGDPLKSLYQLFRQESKHSPKKTSVMIEVSMTVDKPFFDWSAHAEQFYQVVKATVVFKGLKKEILR